MKYTGRTFAVLIIWFGLMIGGSCYGQTVQNPQRDLAGTNYGNQIFISWGPIDGASEYVIYRSRSISGPWQVLYILIGKKNKT